MGAWNLELQKPRGVVPNGIIHYLVSSSFVYELLSCIEKRLRVRTRLAGI